MVIERVMREPLDRLADRFIFGPLGMRQTTFFPERLPAGTPIVPTEIDPWRGRTICGEVHDESAWRLRETMIAGSAGLFTTAGDLLQFLRIILDKGEIDGYQLLSETVVTRMQQNQISHLGLSAGLGWELNQPRYMGTGCTGIIGKTGFTGCVIMADIQAERAMVLLSNCTYPHRKPDATLINQVRSAVANAIFS
jgi:CubicO group peptidase (beta-lactamase class C family)